MGGTEEKERGRGRSEKKRTLALRRLVQEVRGALELAVDRVDLSSYRRKDVGSRLD